MAAQLLYRLPTRAPKRELPRAWLFQAGREGIVAMAYVSDKVELSPFSCTLTFLLFDIKTKTIVQAVASSCSLTDIEALHLVYDPATATWLIGDLEFQDATTSYHVVVRSVHPAEDGQLLLTESLFDEAANDMAPIGPILALHINNNSCMLLYLKPDIDCSSTPEIRLASIDRGTGQIEQSIEGYAESALLCRHNGTSLLLTLIPRVGELSPQMGNVFAGSTRNWGFSLTCYGNSFDTLNWSRVLDIHSPVGKSLVLGRGSDFEWSEINAAAIAGPLLPMNGQQTFVIGITMPDISHLEGSAHTSEKTSRHVDTLVCIDTRGEIVQTCADSIGLRLHLCQATSMVVGVDLMEGRWRLWNWAPLDAAPFQTLVWLDPGILRAHVVRATIDAHANHFWLIEESSVGVRVSKRDAFTLTEVIPAVTLTGIHLLSPQHGIGALDWHTPIEILFYQDTLLLLAIDDNDQPGLYQIISETIR